MYLTQEDIRRTPTLGLLTQINPHTFWKLFLVHFPSAGREVSENFPILVLISFEDVIVQALCDRQI